MFCPKCKAEYSDGFLKCGECNIDLIPELPPEEYTEYEWMNLVNIKIYPSRYEAEMAKGLLSANGIDAMIKDGLEAVGGAAPIFGLLVKEEDADEANKQIELVEEANNKIELNSGPWKSRKELWLEKKADSYMLKLALIVIAVLILGIVASYYLWKYRG